MDAAQTNTDASSQPACPGCVASAKQIADLEKRNANLEARIVVLEEKLEAAMRAGKRQAAPFSRGLPKVDPKRPGRKSGEDYGTKAFRAVPNRIDEIHDAPLPERCPRCGGGVIPSHVDHQYQVEIPRRAIYRRFNVAIGRCACCDGRVQGRHPLQTSDALGCCASQVGADAQSLIVLLNKELGISQGKIRRFFQALYDIQLTRGGSCQIMRRAAKRCAHNYMAIVKRVRQSSWVVPDETGWRIGGVLAWLHVAVTQTAIAYLIARQRGFTASALLIGEDYEGTMTHDGYASTVPELKEVALHQTCIAHLVRCCREMLETATRGAVIFPRKVKALLQEALAVRDQRDEGRITNQAASAKADELEQRLETLLAPAKSNAANERLAKHLWSHGSQLFTFLRQPGIDATNYRAEQAIRPAVVNRKVWGGNRTEAGAEAQSILMSVIFTAARQGRDVLEFMSQTLRSLPEYRPMLLPETG